MKTRSFGTAFSWRLRVSDMKYDVFALPPLTDGQRLPYTVYANINRQEPARAAQTICV